LFFEILPAGTIDFRGWQLSRLKFLISDNKMCKCSEKNALPDSNTAIRNLMSEGWNKNVRRKHLIQFVFKIMLAGRIDFHQLQ
jgi:hypothetical protein